jgi:ribonuclease HII
MLVNKSYPTFDYELEVINKKGCSFVVGLDEAGRGPGAGPVVACAVNIPPDNANRFEGRLKDSKKMTRKQRVRMYGVLVTSYDHGIGIVDNRVIDEINILEATKLAMMKAIAELSQADYALIDGNMKMDNINLPYRSIVKGDSLSLSIAAASVIAKETRDRIMEEYHEEYPAYGWNSNKGYLSKKHVEAISKYGTTPYHRLSFNKVGK